MIDKIKTRRSIRKFKSEKVSEELQNLIKETILTSPSSKNCKSTEFIFIENEDAIKQISNCRPSGSKFIENTPLVVVVLGNSNKTDVWIEDASIAAGFLQLTAHSLGLGSCWVQVRNRFYVEEKTSEKYLREILNIPDYLCVLCIIAIGYPDEIKSPIELKIEDYARIHNETC